MSTKGLTTSTSPPSPLAGYLELTPLVVDSRADFVTPYQHLLFTAVQLSFSLIEKKEDLKAARCMSIQKEA
jgi:hypothetical protein